MTKIKCDYKYDEHDEDSLFYRYCKFRSQKGYCTQEEIIIKNGIDGYALFEPCCQSEE